MNLAVYDIGTNLLNNQPVAIKFVRDILASVASFNILIHFPPIQEPRKSEAPQLRDEYRSYRTLNGTRA